MLERFDPECPFEADDMARASVLARAARIRARRRAARLGGGGGAAMAVAALVAVVLLGGGGGSGEVATRAGLAGQRTTTTVTASTTAADAVTPSTAAATDDADPPRATTTTAPTGKGAAGPGSSPGPPAATAAAASGDLSVEIAVEPGAPRAGELARLRVRVRDRDGVVVSFNADFGDGARTGYVADLACRPPAQASATTAPPTPSDSEETHEHAYRHPGQYALKVSVSTASCTAPHEDATVVVPIAVGGDRSPSNGPRLPTVHHWVTAAPTDPLTGTTVHVEVGDPDGYVSAVEVDWGDGSTPEVIRFDVADCRDDGKDWPSSERNLRHRYRPGTYTYRVRVTSTGCDGRDGQETAATRRVEAGSSTPTSAG
jgi:hypothetical protein